MTHRGRFWFAPTPVEILALIVVAYFFWFISESATGLAAGGIGVLAGTAISRAATLIAPRAQRASAIVWLLILVTLAVVAPFLTAGNFRTTQLAVVAYTAIIVLSLNLITGYTGQTSLGHAALVGVGAYTVAIMIDQWETNIILTFIAATLLAALTGLVIGIPALRLSGHYLAIATLGLGVVFVPIVKLDEVAKYTGGFQGLSLFQYEFGPPVQPDWLTDARWYYFLTVASLGIATLLLANLLNSAVGRSLRAVRDNEIAAAAMGINVALTKLIAFSISAAYAGFAGGLLFIVSNRFVSGDSFTIVYMIELLVAMVVGGRASILGSVLGAFFLVYIYREAIESFAMATEAGSDRWIFIAGTLIAAAVLFGNRWLGRQSRRLGMRLQATYGGPLLNVVKLPAAVALGWAFTQAFRWTAENLLLDISFLRGAITGLVLVIIVLFLPDGIAGLVRRLQRLTWSELATWARAQMLPLPQGHVAVPTERREEIPLTPRQ